ncbi:ComF family protein [Candidatus Gracilibacteria bacterium]|nr:ComF family protein [Candidatus Gracilibacteria bacterium]MCF7819063.1 ComF family protein [Candidatus Gracilibacteria bacterium]
MKANFPLLRQSWTWFLEALFPAKCLVCHEEGSYLCSNHKKFQTAPINQAIFEYLDTIHAAVKYYEPTAEKLVEYLKFHGFRELADIMAEEMVHSFPNNFRGNVLLVPIPLHWSRKFWRGFNQAELIAQAIQKKNPDVSVFSLLKRCRRTRQQSLLPRHQRIVNMQNAFCVPSDIPPKSKEKNIILIDDVVATGATLDAAAKTLKKKGFKHVQAVVFARGGQ